VPLELVEDVVDVVVAPPAPEDVSDAPAAVRAVRAPQPGSARKVATTKPCERRRRGKPGRDGLERVCMLLLQLPPREAATIVHEA
jgi:hypothetical protein